MPDDFDYFLMQSFELNGSKLVMRINHATVINREQAERMIAYLRTAADQMPTLEQRLNNAVHNS
jgi:hypothetical protein